ncbi:MAG: PHD-finger protein [Amphiamblys sp. WSBS2006]|nr:MAG: PHD-finger protein [Amphiamblys sp. WSBS2006]
MDFAKSSVLQLEDEFERYLEGEEELSYGLAELARELREEDRQYEKQYAAYISKCKDGLSGKCPVEESVAVLAETRKTGDQKIKHAEKMCEMAAHAFEAFGGFSARMEEMKGLVSGSVKGTKRQKDKQKGRVCICGGPDSGEMVMCDNSRCKIKWFHLSCTGLGDSSVFPWRCSQCM